MAKKPIVDAVACSGQTRRPGGGFRPYMDRFKPCTKKASVICSDDRKPYCKTCCPSLKRERESAKSIERSAKWARERKHQKLQEAITKADAAIVKHVIEEYESNARSGASWRSVNVPVAQAQTAVSAREKLKALEESAPKPKTHA